MADQDKKASAYKADGVVSDAAALDEIAAQLRKVDSMRRRQVIINCVGSLLIVAFIALFLVRLYNLGSKFDNAKFTETMVGQSAVLLQMGEVKDLQKAFVEVFIPEYRVALATRLADRQETIQKLAGDEGDKLLRFIQSDLRTRVMQRLQMLFEKLDAQLVAKYGKDAPSRDELIKALEDLRGDFLESTTRSLNANIAVVGKRLNKVQLDIESFKESEEYAEVGKLSQGEVENRIIETLLELWIYQLNPNRSKAQADLKGGF